MVELSVKGNHLHIEVLGWSKLLGFKRHLDVPLSAIKRVTASTGLPRFRWTDLRLLGTGIPGVIAVGTYWIGSPRRWAFLDVRKSSKEVVTVEMEGFSYELLIVEVKDAQAAIAEIRARIA
jgi:hypothetical protein